MFCSRCGLRVEEGNQFCQNCGQEVGAVVIAAPAATVATTSYGGYATVPVALPYAGFWNRFLAYLIDGVIIGIPFMIVMIVAVFAFGGFAAMIRTVPREPGDPRAFAAFMAPLMGAYFLGMLVFLVLGWLYFAGMESSERQGTFGKDPLMSLRVTDIDGRRLSFGHASGRFFAKIVSGLVPFAIGYLMAAFTAKKQALHDMIAGTLVLRKT